MKYSRNKINNYGEALLAGPNTGLLYTDASLVIDDWRKLHMVPLEELVKDVTALLSQAGVSAIFSSHRLKRMTSIIAKLKHTPGMRLGGGYRISVGRVSFLKISHRCSKRSS